MVFDRRTQISNPFLLSSTRKFEYKLWKEYRKRERAKRTRDNLDIRAAFETMHIAHSEVCVCCVDAKCGLMCAVCNSCFNWTLHYIYEICFIFFFFIRQDERFAYVTPPAGPSQELSEIGWYGNVLSMCVGWHLRVHLIKFHFVFSRVVSGKQCAVIL